MLPVIQFIVSKYSKSELKRIAEQHGVNAAGDKEDMATRLVLSNVLQETLTEYYKKANGDPYHFTPVPKKHARRLLETARDADEGIRSLVIKLNEQGYYTTMSCSWLTSDHRGKKPSGRPYSYIWFVKTDKERFKRIKNAAARAKLIVEDLGTTIAGSIGTLELPSLPGRRLPQAFPLAGELLEEHIIQVRTQAQASDDEIRKAWHLFEDSLLK